MAYNDTGSSKNIFVNATQARADSRNNVVVHGEIRSIESEVFSNIDAGVLYANVVSSTTMTNSNVYYNVWNGTVTDPTKLAQINVPQIANGAQQNGNGVQNGRN